MRTTLDIDDVALEAARQLAAHRGQSLDAVVSELILKGLSQRTTLSRRGGFPVFPSSGKPITLEDIKQTEDDA
jgi:hypothetical protein